MVRMYCMAFRLILSRESALGSVSIFTNYQLDATDRTRKVGRTGSGKGGRSQIHIGFVLTASVELFDTVPVAMHHYERKGIL